MVIKDILFVLADDNKRNILIKLKEGKIDSENLGCLLKPYPIIWQN